jgi:hypothetical protein
MTVMLETPKTLLKVPLLDRIFAKIAELAGEPLHRQSRRGKAADVRAPRAVRQSGLRRAAKGAKLR